MRCASFTAALPRAAAPAPRRRARACAWAALALATVLLLGCAKTSDVERVDEANRVQDQRLKALEGDVASTLREQRQLLEQLRTDVRGVQGRMELVTERTERLANEQSALTQNLERSLADQRKMSHQVTEQLSQMERFRLESQDDLDKMRTHVDEVVKLLKSPLSHLPAKTAADADFREAFYHLVNGELDIAADAFAAFRKTYPKDARATEALFRQGQAFFLMRKYDHALIPFFELVDKAPKHELATPARWMLARSLEETGDLKLAREFYAQLINEKTAYANDATRRVAFINRLFPRSQPAPPAGKGAN